jgi:exopolysaccharide production protein ExoZ
MSDTRHSKLITLEVARFIASFCVVIEHLGGVGMSIGLGPRLVSGPAPAAVMFFFALSGFVIYNAHWQDAGKTHRLPRYIWRRFWRIYPIYWLSLLPILPLLWAGMTAHYSARVFSLLPFTPIDFPEIDPPAWTLRYEMAFYIMFGLSLLPYLRRVVLPLWFVLLAWNWFGGALKAGPLRAWLNTDGLPAHLFGLFNFMFFAGVAAAFLFVRVPPPARWRWPFLGVSVVFMGVMLWLSHGGMRYPIVPLMPVTAASYAAVIFALAALEQGGQLRLSPRWAILGAMSYPLYLLHAALLLRIDVYFSRVPGSIRHFTTLSLFLAELALALFCAWLTVVLFDRPLQRLTRRVM